MKKLAVLFMVGSLVVSGATTGINTVKAAEAKKPAETKIIDKNMDLKETDKDFFAYPGDTDFKETDKKFFAYPGKSESLKALSEFLKKDTKITKAEKKSLTRDYGNFVKVRKNIDNIAKKIESISKKLTNNWAIEHKLDKLSNKNQALWDKLYEKATDKELAIDDNIEFIKSSKALTEKEKEALIKVQTEIDKLNNEYTKVCDKVEKATKNLNSKLDSLNKDLEKLIDKIQPLADKLGNEFKETFGFTEKIPY